ncbi:DUF4347 domain-containing protein [Schlegelella sp. S2-27]|uniref:DUF4347 domain-containing protein n=1 Tax=Caldimonas mangrovi TaxID=2944811 RepID=A0ABT0YMQ3_9BURK|nr:DUF4347 domain-containing protein [Caldimonas mangrovi]MCM5680003.1 DUF4347 domain-containing protein [Caldimonas mangrovi]
MWWLKSRAPRRSPAGKTSPARSQQPPLMLALEPRIMFDAGVVAAAAGVAEASSDAPPPPAPAHETAADISDALAPAQHPRTEIVFVDTRLPNYDEIVAAAAPGAEIVLLDSNRDGVQQIADALNGRTGIDAIHVVSHGDEGVLLLGNVPLHSGNLTAYNDRLSAIGSALAPDGDILLYGCDVGAGTKGEQFLAALADATAADIAASNDSTGNTRGGGNWTLEITTGLVNAVPAFDGARLQDYDHQLATFSVSTIGELRTALSTAASNGATDTITLLGNISATGTGDMLASSTDGHRTFVDINVSDGQALDIVGGGYTVDANYYGRVVEVRSGTVSIANLTIREGLIAANGGNKGAVGSDALGGAIRNAGTLTLTGVTVTASGASGGGGGGGSGVYAGGGGGGGGGLAGIGGGSGGAGGTSGTNYAGSSGGGGVGGNGGDYTTPINNRHGGRGGSTTGGAGGALGGYASGGTGGTASNGSLSIGGGGGGAAYASNGGRGGHAAGAVYNAGTLTILSSTVSNNVGAAGGGGAGGALQPGVGGGGGIGVGGLWNAAGATLRLDSISNGDLASNAGAGGSGGSGQGNGSAGSGQTNIYNLGTLDTNFSPNSAPTATNLTQTVAYVEDPGGAVALDDIVVTDVDSGDTIIATLTLSTPAAGTLSTGTFGSATATYNAGTGVWTVTGSLTDVNAALAAVAFTPAANRDQDVTITARIRDAANTGPADGTITLDVTPANDAPTATNLTQSKAATEGGGAVALDDIVVTDVDTGDTTTATLTLSDTSAGTLSTGTFGSATSTYNAGTGVWTVTGSVADVNAALAAVALTPSTNNDQNFTITTRVRDAANTGPADGTITVTVTGTNDAPTATNLTQSKAATEAGGAVALDDIVITDVDTGDTLTATLTLSDPAAGTLSTGTFGSATSTYNAGTGVWTVTGSVADVNAALAAVALTPSAHNDQNFTITTRVRDAANAGPADGTITVTVTGTNDAPTATDLTQSKAATEAGGAVALDDIVVTDVDTGDTITATLTLSDTSAGTLSTGTFGSATSTYNTGTGVWTVTGSAADVNAALAAVALTPSANNDQNFSITTRIRDAADTGPADGTITITVTAVNDAPVVTTSGGTSAFTESGSATVVDASLTLSDVDSTTFVSATAAITGNFASGQDVLAFTNDGSTMGNISASYNAATGVLTLTSAGGTATLAQWQAALRSVTYDNSSDAPSTANRTIGFTVNDGGADSNAATKVISVAAVNDAPVVTTPASIGVTEDVASALTGISFSDVDAGGGSVTATLSVASGSLAATSGGGVTVGGTGSALTLTGSIANINIFIAGSNVTFTTASNATADVTLTASVDDGGNTGSGGAQTDSGTTTLQVSAVNDAPVVTTPVSINVTEDVSSALTGISFADADAGSSPVTATFSVGSGSLAATSGGGVTVGGTSSALTLTGSIADINAYIAGGGVAFQTATNATGNVVLTVGIADNGNTGSGGNLDDAETVTLSVTAVNDAPVHGVPAAQSVDQDATLVFSSGNGNLVSVGDVDAGGGTVRVTLTASNGLITLPGTTGLSFIVGSGANDGTMTFEGTIADINSALNGLIFSPTPGYNGAAGLQITTSDLGLSGSGGTQTDTDIIAITVNSLNPEVTNVQVTNPDGGYKVGDTVTVTVTFDQAVNVDTTGGTPTLLLETGTTDRLASYVSGSGSDTLTFSYTVQAGDLSADLDYQSTGALALNGATLRNATDDDAVLTLPATGGANSIAGQHNLIIDGVAPTVGSVSVPADGTYVAGQNLDFTVNFGEAVTVDTTGGTPRIAITLDTGGTVYASYLAGSGTSALSFRYTVQSGHLDSNGIALGGSIDANGGTLRDAVGNTANLALNGVGATTGVQVDAVVPAVASVSVPASGHYNAGDVLSFSVNASEAVVVDTTGGTPRLVLDIGGVTRHASYVSGSGSSGLVFEYTVQAGDTDANGIAVSSLQANGGTLRDAAGNSLNVALTGVGDASGVVVDTTAPANTGIVRVNATPTTAGSVSYTVTFSEAVSGMDAADFTLVTTGSAAGTIATVTQVDGSTYTVVVNGLSGTGSVRLDLNGSGTGMADAAGNALAAGATGEVYGIDRDIPAVASVSVPANGTYVAGQNLDFTVNFGEAVTVDTTGGTPRLAVTLDTGGTVYADYVSGSGTGALVFRYTVQSGHLDSNGIALGGSIDANGGALRDAVGNTATLTLQGVGATAGVQVDAVVPTVATVAVPASGHYNAGDVLSFTVNASEAVLVDSAGGTPRLVLDVGGTTRHATYATGSGGTALVFEYTVQAGDTDPNGIAVGGLQANGGTLRDAAGNDLTVTLAGVGSTAGVVVDTTVPAIVGIVRADPSPTFARSVTYTVSFSEGVTGLDTSDFSLAATGSAAGSVTTVTQVDASTYVVTVGGIAGSGTLQLALASAGSGIADLAGNALAVGGSGDAYQIEQLPPPPPPPPPTPLSPLPPPVAAPAPVFEQPPVTLNPMAPITPIDTPTLTPTGPAADGGLPGTFVGSALGQNPLTPAALSATAWAADAPRSTFIEVGAGNGAGLQAMPDVGDFRVPPGSQISIALPASTFTHSDRNAEVAVEVRMADGRPLPNWLKFDPTTGTLSGRAPDGVAGRLKIEVIARDAKGNRASSQLEIEFNRAAPPARPAGEPRTDLHLPPGEAGFDARFADLPGQPLPSESGRPALAAQFERYGHVAREAERAALLEHLRALAQEEG